MTEPITADASSTAPGSRTRAHAAGLRPLPEAPGFPGQQPGERVLFYQRRHWYLLWQWLRAPLLGALLATLLAAYLGGRLPPGDWPLWFALRAPLLPFLIWAAWRTANWRNDLYIVTERRAIHIDRTYLLREERHEARLDRIQNVTVEIPGPIAHLLNYGTLTLETAGSLGKIRFEGISQPHQIQAQLLDLVEAAYARRLELEQAGEAVQELSRVMDIPQRAQQLFELEADASADPPVRSFLDELLGRELYFGADQVVWRKHWWVMIREAMGPAGLLAVTFLAWLGGAGYIPPGMERQADLLFAFVMAAMGAWLLWVLADWKNDYYVVTREKVVDIEKIPFIYENRREASLGAIQDVSYVKPTFLAQRLNYGNVRLQTAAEGGLFTFDELPDPRTVQAQLVRRIDEYRARRRESDAAAREAETLQWLARYHRATAGPEEAPGTSRGSG